MKLFDANNYVNTDEFVVNTEENNLNYILNVF